MLGGNTFTAVRRSTNTKPTISIALTTSKTAVSAMLVGTWTMLTANAAALNSSTDQTGTRTTDPARSGSAWPAGNTIGTSAAIATDRIAMTPNAQRHNPNWANRPPTAGPTTVATPHIADTNADARVHSTRGRVVVIRA